MASIIAEFPEFFVAAIISRDTVTNVNGIKTPVRATVETVECLFYEGATAEASVSERFRDITDAVILVYPETDIEKNDIVSVDGVEYHVIGIDNVGKANEVVTVAMAVFA